MLGLFAMGLAADAYATDPLLRRTPGSWLYGPETVWTDGNAGSGYLFHPLSEAMGTAGWRHPGLKATRIARLEAASRSVRVFFDL
ncbi:MAG TPA: hypothetical protein PKY30_10300 [Myxococcota bacterium]|nr:hypothetical protein [Myxococcota bacterium]